MSQTLCKDWINDFLKYQTNTKKDVKIQNQVITENNFHWLSQSLVNILSVII